MLHTIRYRVSLDSILELGLDYSQIADLLSNVMQEQLVEDSNENGLILTNKGLEVLEWLNKQIYPMNSKAWILPLEENRIPKIDKFDIYLPRKKKPAE
jgi:hypothetical protein